MRGMVSTIWNRKDYTNLKNGGSIGSIVSQAIFSVNSDSELGRGAVKEKNSLALDFIFTP